MLRIESVKVFHQTGFGFAETILRACIGERINLSIVFYFEDLTLSGEDNGIRFKPATNLIGTLDNAKVIRVDDSTFVPNINVGDKIRIQDTTLPLWVGNGVVTVSEKLDGNTFRVLEAIEYGIFWKQPTNDEGYLANETLLRYCKINFGVSDGGTVSQVTGENLAATEFEINATMLIDISFVSGLESLLNEKISIRRYQPDTESRQFFQLDHSFNLGPLFLADQFEDLRAKIAPSYWQKKNDLRYRLLVELGANQEMLSDSKRFDIDFGKFGWFDTRFDGAKSEFKMTGITFQKPDLTFVDSLEYEGDVKIVATFTRNDPGVAIGAEYNGVFCFSYLPLEDTLYQNNGKTQQENFVFDNLKVNATSSNGQYFGTSKQIIKNAILVKPNIYTLKLTATINFGTASLATLRQRTDAWYNIWIIIATTSNDNVPSNDKSCLLLQTGKLYESLTKVDLLSVSTRFIEHPYETFALGKSTIEMFPVDDVVAQSRIQLNYTGLESDGIVIESVTATLDLEHATENNINLESFAFQTVNAETVGNLPSVQEFDIEQNRGYKVPDSIRKIAYLKNNYSADSGLVRNWVLSVPFFNRYEYWIKLLGVSNIPEELFAPTLPNRGINHFWDRLTSISGWSLNYNLRFVIRQNGKLFEQTFTSPLLSQDFGSNTVWSAGTIQAFDTTSNTEIIVGADKYVYDNKKVKIVATFTRLSGTVSNFAIVIWGERYEGGGITEVTQISSVYVNDSQSWFSSTDASNKVKTSNVGNICKGECFLDYSKLPQSAEKITLYARIYEISGVVVDPFARITQNDIVRDLQDDQYRIVQN